MAKFWLWFVWILISACAIAAPVFGNWGWPVLVIWGWVAVAHKGELSRLTEEIEMMGGGPLRCLDGTVWMISTVVGLNLLWGMMGLLDSSVTLNASWAVIAALTVGVLGFKTWIKTIDRM